MKTQFSDIKDPELRRELEAVMAAHTGKPQKQMPPEVDAFPRYVFSRGARSGTVREPGSTVRVRNGLDEEPRGGTVMSMLGRAYLVDVGDMVLLVHEPDDSWVPFDDAEEYLSG